MQQAHQSQHERRPCPSPGQVEAIDSANPVLVQHERQADIQAGEKEERQQHGVVQRDVAELRQERDRVLQLQRVERIRGGRLVSPGRREDQRHRQPRQQRRPVPHSPAPARS